MFTIPRRLINDPKSMQHEWQKDHMYAERGPWVTHVPTLSIITLQNIVPNVRNEDGNNLVSFLCTCDYSNKMCALYYHSL